MVRLVGLIALLAAALVLGGVVAVAAAIIGHHVLVAVYGAELAPIDDTPPMIIAVWTAYLAGAVAALAVLVFGWRRLVWR